MMWDAFHLIDRNLVRDDRQPTIQLHCITIDNLAIVPASQFNGQLPGVIS